MKRRPPRSTLFPYTTLYLSLDFFGGFIRIDLGNERSIQQHASDPGQGPARANPADRRPGEGEGRLRARRRRVRGAAAAPRYAACILAPAGGVGDGRGGLLNTCRHRGLAQVDLVVLVEPP